MATPEQAPTPLFVCTRCLNGISTDWRPLCERQAVIPVVLLALLVDAAQGHFPLKTNCHLQSGP